MSFGCRPGGEDYWWARAFNNSSSFWAAAVALSRCAGCAQALRAGAFDAHHVLREQHCRAVGAPTHHPDNALALCTGGGQFGGCHAAHHNRVRLVCTRALSDEAVLFCFYWQPAAMSYLRREYDDATQPDSRLPLLDAVDDPRDYGALLRALRAV